jgi:hypothetical protein
MLQTYKIWEGERTFLPGDDTNKYKVFEITGEELGWFEDVIDGKTYYVYQTSEGEVVINIVEQSYGIGEPSRAVIFRFLSLEEAAQSEQRYALEELRLI